MSKWKYFYALLLIFITLEAVTAIWCWRKPSCYCTFKKGVSISCKNVQDLSGIRGLLRKFPTINSLRISGNFTSLPSKAFGELSILVLTLVSPLKDIADDSLLGIESLKILRLNQSRFEKLPFAVTHKNVQVLQSTFGLITSIHDELQNMSTVTIINLSNNRISLVSETAFHGTANVETLNLSYNQLTSLDPEVFLPLKFLKTIDLKKNQLHSIDGCLDLLNPRVIDLYGNNLTNVDRVFHSNMWSVEYLDLGGNPHLSLSASTFNDSMKSLSELHLSDIGFNNLDPSLLKNFQMLHKLYLNKNNLTYFPEDFFVHTPSLSVLEVSDNRLLSAEALSSKVGDYPRKSSFKIVKLDGNELTSLSVNESFENVATLDISRNRISTIKKEDMVHMKKLRHLNISNNEIDSVEASCFGSSRYLSSLQMSGSLLPTLNGALWDLPNLNYFDMSSSWLESLSEDDFSGSTSIKGLFFRNNSLSSVYGAFRNLKYLSYLDISVNNLTTLTNDSFQFLSGSTPLRVLSMENNSWVCDCRLAWIVDWLHENGTKLRDDPICASPPRLRGQHIRSLNGTDFKYWLEDCPTECQCLCQVDGIDAYTAIKCSGMSLNELPKVFPLNARIIDVSRNNLDSFDGQDVAELKELKTLNFDSNKLTKVTLVGLPSEVSTISLANNMLRSFPLDDIGDIRMLALSGNPWICNCDAWQFRSWLLDHNDSITDLPEVRCGPDESIFLRNKSIITLTRNDLCSTLSLVMIIFISVIATLLLSVCFSCYCFRHSVAAILYSWGFVCIKRDSHDMPYDAFLLYSPRDESLAKEITTGLEDKNHHFMICIPSRDIISPRTPERVTAFMLQCSKIIVFLTRKFLDDEECMNLFKSSMSFSIDSSAKDIIVIMQDRIPTSELDPALTAILKSCTCLHWKQKLFWQKLKYNLPKKGGAFEMLDDHESHERL